MTENNNSIPIQDKKTGKLKGACQPWRQDGSRGGGSIYFLNPFDDDCYVVSGYINYKGIAEILIPNRYPARGYAHAVNISVRDYDKTRKNLPLIGKVARISYQTVLDVFLIRHIIVRFTLGELDSFYARLYGKHYIITISYGDYNVNE